MGTIDKEIKISGTALMEGKESFVRILPSDKKGIYFYPNNSDKGIKACPENIISTQNFVVAGDKDTNIKLIEHFMATCAFKGIDSLEVLVSSSEMPILDGSALNWIEAFDSVGVNETNQERISIKEPLYYSYDKTSITMLPAEEFKVTYCVNFTHPELENRWMSWSPKEDHKQIYEARTFGYCKDLDKFQKMGLALGANFDNTVGLTDTGYTVELRSKYEPVKHKILDLLGDLNLYINPFRLNAHVIAINAGHTSHVEFAKVLQKYMENTK